MVSRFVTRAQQLAWAIVLVVLAALAIPLFVFTVVSGALIVVWVGLPLTLLSFALLRPYADLHRRWAASYLHSPVPSPYRPWQGRNVLTRIRDLGQDRSTWRDLLWLLVNASFGLALTIVCLVEAVFNLVFFFVPKPPLIGVQALLVRRMLGADENQLLALRVEELTASRAETVDTQSAELRRIERDLHDGAQARLVALGMSLGLAEELLETNPEAARQLVTEARTATGDALIELRDLVRGIHPPVLADRGLVGALQALVLASPLRITTRLEAPRLPAPVESAAYFAVCEVLTNALKHSGAGSASLELSYDEEVLRARISDDGRGGADPARGTGLHGIARRLASFDGTLDIDSPVGGPTVITLELPCASSSPKTSRSSVTG